MAHWTQVSDSCPLGYLFQNLNLGKTSIYRLSQISFNNLIGYILSISICMQNFIIVFFSVHFFRIWSSAKPRPIKNVISQSLGLDLVNVKLSAKFYQNIPNGLIVNLHFFNINIPLSARDCAVFTFSEFVNRQSLDR